MNVTTRKTITGILMLLALLLSGMAWSQHTGNMRRILPAEHIPATLYHAGLPTISVPYIEDGVLYLSEIEKYGAGAGTEVSKKVIADENVTHLFDVQDSTGQFLYQVADDSVTCGESFCASLWIGDTTGETRELYSGAGYSVFSPGGTRIAVTDNNFELHIIDTNGDVLTTIGNGTQSVFSADGTKLAYHKLSKPENGMFPEELGIFVYDLGTNKEYIINDTHGSYGLVGFSADDKVLYYLRVNESQQYVEFCSSNYVDSQNTVCLDDVKLPYLFEKTVRNSAGDKFYFDGGDGNIFVLKLLPGSKEYRLNKITGASHPFWLEMDRELAVRKKDTGGKTVWHSIEEID